MKYHEKTVSDIYKGPSDISTKEEELGIVAHTFDVSTQEAEAGWPCEFQANLFFLSSSRSVRVTE